MADDNTEEEAIVGGNVSLMVSIFERKQDEERRVTTESPQSLNVSRREEGDLMSSFNASLREEEEERQRQMEELREKLKEERGLIADDARIVQTTSEVLLTMEQQKDREMELIRAQLKEERVNISEDGKIVETSRSALLSEEEAKRVQLELEKAELARQRIQLSGDANIVEKAKGALFTAETDGRTVSATKESVMTYQQDSQTLLTSTFRTETCTVVGDATTSSTAFGELQGRKVEVTETATTYMADEVEGKPPNIAPQAEITSISDLNTTVGETEGRPEIGGDEMKSMESVTSTAVLPSAEIEKTIGDSQILIDDIIALTRAQRAERMLKRQTTSSRTVTYRTSGDQMKELTKTEAVLVENGESVKADDAGVVSFHATACETRVETAEEGAKPTVTTVTAVRTRNTQSGETESAAANRMSREELQQHIPEPLPEVPGIDFKQFDDVCDMADVMLREEDNPPEPVQEEKSYRRRRAVGPPLGGIHAYYTGKGGGTVTRVVRRHVFMTRT